MKMQNKLREAIYGMETKGTSRKDLKLVMSHNFYTMFCEECMATAGFTFDRITHFEGIPIEQTHYLPSQYCAIIDEKELFKNLKTPNISVD